ncbi:hypothetical protein IE53DRAFT_269167 [Violaceomyces palustris]|uniref:Uncharacterized protein n=1 Tax=Violaceomyces palustris TaxID=1673888 RepID=A0ACD0P3G3_9BASI|nr:hypothetical protein IE53DRAFT_269167 [Violaceomyces palustris]
MWCALRKRLGSYLRKDRHGDDKFQIKSEDSKKTDRKNRKKVKGEVKNKEILQGNLFDGDKFSYLDVSIKRAKHPWDPPVSPKIASKNSSLESSSSSSLGSPAVSPQAMPVSHKGLSSMYHHLEVQSSSFSGSQISKARRIKDRKLDLESSSLELDGIVPDASLEVTFTGSFFERRVDRSSLYAGNGERPLCLTAEEKCVSPLATSDCNDMVSKLEILPIVAGGVECAKIVDYKQLNADNVLNDASRGHASSTAGVGVVSRDIDLKNLVEAALVPTRNRVRFTMDASCNEFSPSNPEGIVLQTKRASISTERVLKEKVAQLSCTSSPAAGKIQNGIPRHSSVYRQCQSPTEDLSETVVQQPFVLNGSNWGADAWTQGYRETLQRLQKEQKRSRALHHLNFGSARRQTSISSTRSTPAFYTPSATANPHIFSPQGTWGGQSGVHVDFDALGLAYPCLDSERPATDLFPVRNQGEGFQRSIRERPSTAPSPQSHTVWPTAVNHYETLARNFPDASQLALGRMTYATSGPHRMSNVQAFAPATLHIVPTRPVSGVISADWDAKKSQRYSLTNFSGMAISQHQVPPSPAISNSSAQSTEVFNSSTQRHFPSRSSPPSPNLWTLNSRPRAVSRKTELVEASSTTRRRSNGGSVARSSALGSHGSGRRLPNAESLVHFTDQPLYLPCSHQSHYYVPSSRQLINYSRPVNEPLA